MLEAAPARYPASPPLVALVAGVAATVALEWLVLRSHYAPSAFYAVHLGRTLELDVHHVYRVPRCPACSDSAAVAAPLPWHKEHAGVGG